MHANSGPYCRQVSSGVLRARRHRKKISEACGPPDISLPRPEREDGDRDREPGSRAAQPIAGEARADRRGPATRRERAQRILGERLWQCANATWAAAIVSGKIPAKGHL